MFRLEGGLPAVLAPLTKPEQPLNTRGASPTTKSGMPCWKRLPILRRDSPEHPRFTIASTKTTKTRPKQTIMSPSFPAPPLACSERKRRRRTQPGATHQVLEVLLPLRRGRVCADDWEETTGQEVRNRAWSELSQGTEIGPWPDCPNG